jgi:hypothetical protein
VFQQLSYEGNHEMRAAVASACQVIYNVSPDTSWEAYRVDTDPAERHDVDSESGPCATVRGELEKWYDAAQVPAGAAEALLPGKPDVTRPLNIAFGDEIELLGVDAPTQVKVGDVATLTWTFAAHGALPDGWKVFVHIENGRGGRFTGDHFPVRPFSWWRAGQFIRYSTQVSVPHGSPPGHYEIWAGIWKGPGAGTRKPAHTTTPGIAIKDNRVDVGALEVVP